MVAAVTVGLVAAAFVGCGGGGMSVDGPTATVPTLPPTTADPYAVRAVIDEAYVNRVLAGLDHAVGDVVRLVVVARAVLPEAVQRLNALYVGEYLQLQENVLRNNLTAMVAAYKTTPRDRQTITTRLISARPECVFVQVARDYPDTGVGRDPRGKVQWVALIPLDPANDPNHYNNTSWVYVYDGFEPGFAQPEDPCEKRSS